MSLVTTKKRRTPVLSNAFMSDPFFSDFFDRRGFMKNFLNSNGDSEVSPAMNIKEKEKVFEVELAAPGLKKEDFNITLDNGLLTISAEREDKKEEEKEGFVTREFSYNSFSRSVSIPESIDEDKDVSAQYEDGVLKLKLHKKEGMEAKKPKTIKVS
ncbi:Hsp20/alpha crystallin family protein [Salinimicrobium tongyeongense]|jgi:HSP20 family protein|uniref:Hsp20/alpha crystallin family protein n=1 Tax=Salinimicrobium tongyeongense TaxID=2809707 RepID=A0ABY6NQ44_9FLAO|nr:Hsp20/alpha crystallin family protein [Salinimicrobium tongyeongense]UZH54706.1 Hsp20/alpha crystallin family protein [Salinimicrobium tongyeongense]